MARPKRIKVPHAPRVALIVETSLASGRGILRGIARYLREHEPWSIYHEPRSREDPAPTWLKNWPGDGIIARLHNRQMVAAVAATGLPAVDVLGLVSDSKPPLVGSDNRVIARLAAEHLLERGFKHFGHCGIRGFNFSERQRDAFMEIVQMAGGQCGVHELAARGRARSSWETQQQRLAKWVRHLPKPAGVMACDDTRGQRLLDACRRAGVLVPEEVAAVGVNNDIAVCEISHPPLSSVVPNTQGIGYEAAGLLDRLMRGKSAPSDPTLLAPTGLVCRQSSDVLAIEDHDIAMAVRFIREQASGSIRVEDVANHVSLSRSVLKRRFARLLGRSVHEEIIRARVRQVEELLSQTDMPIKLIARKTGFKHQEYMGAVFKSKLGKTPGQYRKQSPS